uniref:Uncharacterized protein n=1 Tax=Cannabis sativa TaxID=3483 RepID=A0A803Q218_CANSA
MAAGGGKHDGPEPDVDAAMGNGHANVGPLVKVQRWHPMRLLSWSNNHRGSFCSWRGRHGFLGQSLPFGRLLDGGCQVFHDRLACLARANRCFLRTMLREVVPSVTTM